MVRKYSISEESKRGLADMVCRFKQVRTYLDEQNERILLYTNAADMEEPNSSAGEIPLVAIDEED